MKKLFSLILSLILFNSSSAFSLDYQSFTEKIFNAAAKKETKKPTIKEKNTETVEKIFNDLLEPQKEEKVKKEEIIPIKKEELNPNDLKNYHPLVQLNLDNISLSDFAKYMYIKYQTTVLLPKEIDSDQYKFSIHIVTDSVRKALERVCSILDFKLEKKAPNIYELKKYETKMFFINRGHDLQQYYDSQGKKILVNQLSVEKLEEKIRPLLSKEGTITSLDNYSLIVRDRPSRVRLIENVLNAQESQKDYVCYNIRILKLKKKEKLNSNINFASIISIFGNKMIVGNVTNFSPSGMIFVLPTSKLLALMNIVKENYDIEEVKDFSGISRLSKKAYFSDEKDIFTGKTVIIKRGDSGLKEDSPESVGYEIIIDALKKNSNTIDISIYYRISEIVGNEKLNKKQYKIIRIAQSDLEAPINYGNSLVIAGIKGQSKVLSEKGLVGLKDLPAIGNLFKKKRVINSHEEYMILISVSKLNKKMNNNEELLF